MAPMDGGCREGSGVAVFYRGYVAPLVMLRSTPPMEIRMDRASLTVLVLKSTKRRFLKARYNSQGFRYAETCTPGAMMHPGLAGL